MLAGNGQFGRSIAGGGLSGGTFASTAQRQQSIQHGGFLFQDGDRRIAAFRVTEGALCHYMVWPDGSHDVIEFVFPGDIVGLGTLPDHISTAQAMVDTNVEPLSEFELAQILSSDAALAARLASTADREFEIVRRRALGNGHRTPLQRVAAYILAMAHAGCRSGESTAILADITGGPALANLLELGSDELTAALTELETRGVISTSPAGLVIEDRDGLASLADS